MTRSKLFLSLLLCLQLGALGHADSVKKIPPPDATKLFRQASGLPTHAYEGHMMITQWIGSQPKAEEARIYFRPPNAYRLEFLLPDGSLDRVVMSDGKVEKVQIMKNGTVTKEYVNRKAPRFLTPEQEKELLFANYKVNLIGSEFVLGRSAWVIELSPASSGKPLHQVRVDEKTHIVLETKRYTAEGKTLSVTRFTRFDVREPVATTQFLSTEDAQGMLEQDGVTMTLEASPVSGYPTMLAGGFSLLNSDNFELKGQPIRYLKYTDGLLPLSMFETPLPVKIPTDGQTKNDSPGVVQWGPSGPTQSYVWNKGNQYYTLVGEVDHILLEQIASSLP